MQPATCECLGKRKRRKRGERREKRPVENAETTSEIRPSLGAASIRMQYGSNVLNDRVETSTIASILMLTYDYDVSTMSFVPSAPPSSDRNSWTALGRRPMHNSPQGTRGFRCTHALRACTAKNCKTNVRFGSLPNEPKRRNCLASTGWCTKRPFTMEDDGPR